MGEGCIKSVVTLWVERGIKSVVIFWVESKESVVTLWVKGV